MTVYQLCVFYSVVLSMDEILVEEDLTEIQKDAETSLKQADRLESVCCF